MSRYTADARQGDARTAYHAPSPPREGQRARCLPHDVNAFANNKPSLREPRGVSAKTAPLTASAAIWYIDTEEQGLPVAPAVPCNGDDALVTTPPGGMDTYQRHKHETASRSPSSRTCSTHTPAALPPAPQERTCDRLGYDDALQIYARMSDRLSILPPRAPALLMSSPSVPSSLACVAGRAVAVPPPAAYDETQLTSAPPQRGVHQVRRRRFCRRNDAFGPLLVVAALAVPAPVPRSHIIALCDTAHAGTPTSPGTWCSLSRTEAASYCNAVRNLQDALTRAQANAEAARRSAVRETEQTMRRHLADYQADERRRRQQFQKTLDDLREANVALTAQLDAMHCRGALAAATAPLITTPTGMTAAVAATTAAATSAATSALDVQPAGEESQGAVLGEVEWARREQELDGYWRHQMRDAQAHYEASLTNATRARDELVAQVRQLTRAADELHQTVHQLRDEAAMLGMQNAQLKTRCARLHDAMQTQGAKSLADMTREVRRLQAELQARDARERAMMAELEDGGASNAREQQAMAAQLRCLQDALDKERSRSAALVQLYSSQIESLHAQLEDVTHRPGSEPRRGGCSVAID